MSCKKHKKYTGKRRPSTPCVDCWKLYLEIRGITVAEVLKKVKMTAEMADFLKENEVELETVKASISERAVVSVFGSATVVPELHVNTKSTVSVRGQKV